MPQAGGVQVGNGVQYSFRDMANLKSFQCWELAIREGDDSNAIVVVLEDC